MSIDSPLIFRARNGDELAFAEIVRSMSGRLWSLARTNHALGLEPDDLFQEGLIATADAVRRFDISSGVEFESFAYHCAKRRIFSAIRTAGKVSAEPINQGARDSVLEAQGAPLASVPRKVEEHALLSLIFELAAHLSVHEREVLCLTAVGVPNAEIAEILGRTPKSIENAARRYRLKLKEGLAACGWQRTAVTTPSPTQREEKESRKVVVLAALEKAGCALSKREIATRAGIVTQGLHALLARLEREGAITSSGGLFSPAPASEWPSHWKVREAQAVAA